MAVLTYARRERLPASAFVYPSTRRYPIHDIRHARNALARVATFGTASEQARVRAEVHRRYPEIGEESNPGVVGDVVGAVVPIAVLVGGGILLVGWLQRGGATTVGKSIGDIFSNIGTAVRQTPGKVAGGGQPNQPGPGNTTQTGFNINTDVSQVRLVAAGALGAVIASAHIGVGHWGDAGTYVCRLWVQSSGAVGLGATGPVELGEKQFSVNQDADVTGYGIDFGAAGEGPFSGFWNPFGMTTWADIVDGSGTLMTQANIAAISV